MLSVPECIQDQTIAWFANSGFNTLLNEAVVAKFETTSWYLLWESGDAHKKEFRRLLRLPNRIPTTEFPNTNQKLYHFKSSWSAECKIYVLS
jgi:hypothetical protein